MKRVFDTQLIGPFAALLLVIIIVALTTERFLYLGNLSNLFLQVSIVALIAIGSTVVIFAAGIDLSSGSMVALLTMILAQMLKFIGIPLVFALPLIFVVGGFNGSGIGVGTLFGEQIAIKASEEDSDEIRIIESRNKPTWLPPDPFLNIGVKLRLIYERFRARSEI